MQWYRETIWIDTPAGRASEQALVEGRIAPPASQPAVEEVLMLNARVVNMSAEPMSNRVMLEGRVFFNVVYAGAGSTWAFESSATFKHGMDMPGLEAGARCRANVSIAGIEHTTEAGVINVRAAVNINCDASMQKELQLFTSGQDLGDVQMLNDNMEVASRVDTANSSMLLRDEVMIAQGLPACERMLHTGAWASVQRITCEDGKMVVEGDVHVTTTYLCSDPAAPLQQRDYTLPFAHMIMMRDVKEGMQGCAWVNVAEIYAQTVGSNEGEARAFGYEMVLNIEAEAIQTRQINMVCDVYSPTRVLAVSRTDVEMQKLTMPRGGQTMYQNTVPYEGKDRGLRVLCTHAYPLMANAECGPNKVMVEGVAFVRAVCIDREGTLVPQEMKMPFSIEVDGGGCSEDMSLNCMMHITGAQAQYKGDEIEVKLAFGYTLCMAKVQRMSLLTGVTMTEEAVEPMSGITVYFAEPGEKLWSIAKRYATTVDAIKQANPAVTDNELPAGSRLILYRPGA
ncbi:MAG: DUF3794 and LysM peptidoglycan-binding domain-containing protein [Bacillota bacterium]